LNKGRFQLILAFFILEAMIYKSKESKLFIAIIYAFIVLTLILPVFIYLKEPNKIIPAFFLFMVLGFISYFLVKIRFNTYYIFEKDSLNCKSWILKRNILFSDIDGIETQVGLYAGLKLSLSSKGIVIHYNKGNKSLFISPENEIEFVKLLEEKTKSSKEKI
jgi:energy-coupling factor transporter transmembrane protein EcfT